MIVAIEGVPFEQCLELDSTIEVKDIETLR
jgi:hypothetical protein